MTNHPFPPLRITRVELKNIKNHAEGEWAFQPGVVAICGPNGAGKTTILEAIAWTLFDHLDYKRDDFVKRGTKRGQVTVHFISDFDNREYVVTRDTGGGYYVHDPETRARIVEQKNQVLPWICRHLGVEPETDLAALFKSTIGVPQGTFTYDFTLAPSYRKSVFDQILKVEDYRKASDNLRETTRHLENQIVEAGRKLAEAEGELKIYDETKRSCDEAEFRLQLIQGEHAVTIAERERFSKEVESYEELRRKIDAERRAIEQLSVKLEVKRDTLFTAREGVEQARAAAAIIASARAGYENYLSASCSLSELEKRREIRNQLRERIGAIEYELIEARSQAKIAKDRLIEIATSREDLANLAEKIERQNAIEAEIAVLREGRGEKQSLERSRTALERELEKLRNRYSELSRLIAQAEAQRESAEMVESFEAERALLEEKINQSEVAINQSRHKREQIDRLRKEQERLTAELEETRSDLAKAEPLVAVAGRLAGAEAARQDETENLARLRAEVARDEEMVQALDQGGVCPLLTEKCLNLKPGESIDSRFRMGLDSRRNEISRLQSFLIELDDDVKQMREAAFETSRLSRLRSESSRLAEELVSKQNQIASIEEEIAANVDEMGLQKLKERRVEIETQLRRSRESQRVFSQAELLRSEIQQVQSAGEDKKHERDGIIRRLETLGNIESMLSDAESRLQSLNDPRGRAAALRELIEREGEFKQNLENAEIRVAKVNENLEKANLEIQPFTTLDAELTSSSQLRSVSERDYQSYIANEKIADTLAAREEEMASLTSEIEQAENVLTATVANCDKLSDQYDAESHRRAMNGLDGLRERVTQLASQIEHTSEQFSKLRIQLDQLEEARARARHQIAERERTERLRETSDFIRDILQKAAPFITESYLFSISIEANHLFREITGRHDVTLQWTKDYEITLEEEGRERPFLNLSGGEQMAAALAVRLALLKELSEVNIAFFDEPTTNMDEERRRNLAQQIGRIKDFHQLFVISHDDSFEGYTDQIISLG